MASVGGTVAAVLSVLLGLAFALAGAAKLFPALNSDLYKEMVANFIKYSPVFPLADMTGFRPPPDLYRQVVGSIELVSGPGLIFFPAEMKTLCNGLLFTIMCGAGYTHMAVGEPIVVPLVLGVLLGCVYVLRCQGAPSKEKTQ